MPIMGIIMEDICAICARSSGSHATAQRIYKDASRLLPSATRSERIILPLGSHSMYLSCKSKGRLSPAPPPGRWEQGLLLQEPFKLDVAWGPRQDAEVPKGIVLSTMHERRGEPRPVKPTEAQSLIAP